MVTFIPTTRLVRDATDHPGFKPLVIVRNAKGQCVGSKSERDVYVTADAALRRAVEAANNAADSLRHDGYAVTVAA